MILARLLAKSLRKELIKTQGRLCLLSLGDNENVKMLQLDTMRLEAGSS